jgi:FMN phosphatase YigB (HAD superfamily)
MKKKFTLLILALIISLGCLHYQVHKNYTPQALPYNLSPATTVIAFDLHEVILKPDIKKMITTFFKEIPLSNFLFLLTHPLTFYHLWANDTRIFEKRVIDLGISYPETKPFLALVRKITNCQIVMHEMIPIINELKQRGYKIYLLSNIEQDTFQELEQKLPILTTLFDGTFTPCSGNAWNAKPSQQFYQQFFSYLEQQGEHQKKVIFIDNSKVNIKGAEKAGMYGILFTSPAALTKLFDAHIR